MASVAFVDNLCGALGLVGKLSSRGYRWVHSVINNADLVQRGCLRYVIDSKVLRHSIGCKCTSKTFGC